jgi:hypothetical protein
MTEGLDQEPALWPEEAPEPAPPVHAGMPVPPAAAEPAAGRTEPREHWPPLDWQRRHCGSHWCRCSHDSGCEFGWIDTGHDRVVPCPQCQPDKIQRHDETRPMWLARLRRARR